MYNRFCKNLSNILGWLCGVLLILVLSLAGLNIIIRNIFSVSWLVIEVVQKLSFIWMIFIGISVVFYHGDHLKMDFFSNKFSPKVKTAMDWLSWCGTMSILLVMVWYGFVVTKVRMTIPFEIYKSVPTGWLYLAVPVSAILMLLFSFDHLTRLLKTRSIDAPKTSN